MDLSMRSSGAQKTSSIVVFAIKDYHPIEWEYAFFRESARLFAVGSRK